MMFVRQGGFISAIYWFYYPSIIAGSINQYFELACINSYIFAA